jgi:hypothetical protein
MEKGCRFPRPIVGQAMKRCCVGQEDTALSSQCCGSTCMEGRGAGCCEGSGAESETPRPEMRV